MAKSDESGSGGLLVNSAVTKGRTVFTDKPNLHAQPNHDKEGVVMNEHNQKHDASPIHQSAISESETKVYEDIRAAIVLARTNSINAINTAMVTAYWEIGKQIAEAVGDRADYGKQLLQFLSEKLTTEFGKGFTVANLRNMRQFYQTFPIRYALRSELTWTLKGNRENVEYFHLKTEN